MSLKDKLIVPWLLAAAVAVIGAGCPGPSVTVTDTSTVTATITTSVTPTVTSTPGIVYYPGGDHDKILAWDGQDRTYILHIPTGADSTKSLPLVFCLHGAGGTANELVNVTLGGFNTLADRDGFFVIYPNALDARWNDLRDPEFSQSDDVGFFSELIDRMIRDYNVDSDRVYVTGISNGSQMTMCLAREMTDRIAAVAPVCYAMSEKSAALPVADGPISVLVMTGTQDPLLPWEGGEVADLGGERLIGPMLSVRDTIIVLAAHDQCNPTPVANWLPDTDPQDGTRVRVEEYKEGSQGTEVVLYAIVGGGHTWPGGWHPATPGIGGNTCLDIVATDVIWGFFQGHSK
jgi:polyhydroxybutyrate depolymerase